MTTTLARRFGLAALLLALALPGGAASAIRPDGVITLGPASFQVQDCEWEHAYLDYDFMIKDPTYAAQPLAAFRVEEGAASVSLAAPVHLPEGAQVTGVIVSYYDTDPVNEPVMGLYAVGEGGQTTLMADASGQPGFWEGVTKVRYGVKPFHFPAGTPYEFRVTLNRAPKEPMQENALFRVQILYRLPVR
jgi:hypothetical protein